MRELYTPKKKKTPKTKQQQKTLESRVEFFCYCVYFVNDSVDEMKIWFLLEETVKYC